MDCALTRPPQLLYSLNSSLGIDLEIMILELDSLEPRIGNQSYCYCSVTSQKI
jgi:hypothetical protein